MATQTTILHIDDLTGDPANETIQFGLDSKFYEIDLSDANATKLRGELASYVEKARRVTNGKRAPRATTPIVRPDREQTQAVREWARAAGYPVSDRGRISRTVQEAFDAAH